MITGTSTGFGRALAQELINQGYPVAITARHVEQVSTLVEGHDQAIALTLDVTKKEQVRDATEQVLKKIRTH